MKTSVLPVSTFAVLASLASAATLELAPDGIEFDAGAPIGKIRFSYPLVFREGGNPQQPASVDVTNRTAYVSYPCGAAARVVAEEGGAMRLVLGKRPDGALKVSQTFGANIDKLLGANVRWSVKNSEPKAFSAEKPADAFLFRGDALEARFSAEGCGGFGIDIPFGYQELQDQRVWNTKTVKWISYSHLPTDADYLYRLVTADGSPVEVKDAGVKSTGDIYVPYPDGNNASLWPGRGPIRTFGWQDGIRRNFFARRAADENAIVFTGDSLTENWRDVAKCFPGYKIANRGVGGDTSQGILWRMKHDVLPLKPQMVCICSGGNDLTAHGDPADNIHNLELMLKELREYDPKMPVAVMTVPPSSNPQAPLKPGAWETLNGLIRETAAKYPDQVVLVDLAKACLDADGNQRLELFGKDRLHLGPEGYKVWRSLLEPVFAKVFPRTAPMAGAAPDLAALKLVWSDEFDGTEIDKTKWDMPIHRRQGASTWHPRNVSVSDGTLKIAVKRTKDPVWRYDTACVRTAKGYKPEDSLYSFKYGYVETSLKMPAHIRTDYWVGFWLFSGGIFDPSSDTRKGTEIDIFESFNLWNRGSMHHTIHWGGYGPKHNASGISSGPHPEILDGGFHKYGLYWDEQRYVFYVDGVPVGEMDAKGLGSDQAPKIPSQGTSQVPQYIKLSVEAAPWCGQHSGWESELPESDVLECDYVRVYQ